MSSSKAMAPLTISMNPNDEQQIVPWQRCRSNTNSPVTEPCYYPIRNSQMFWLPEANSDHDRQELQAALQQIVLRKFGPWRSMSHFNDAEQSLSALNTLAQIATSQGNLDNGSEKLLYDRFLDRLGNTDVLLRIGEYSAAMKFYNNALDDFQILVKVPDLNLLSAVAEMFFMWSQSSGSPSSHALLRFLAHHDHTFVNPALTQIAKSLVSAGKCADDTIIIHHQFLSDFATITWGNSSFTSLLMKLRLCQFHCDLAQYRIASFHAKNLKSSYIQIRNSLVGAQRSLLDYECGLMFMKLKDYVNAKAFLEEVMKFADEVTLRKFRYLCDGIYTLAACNYQLGLYDSAYNIALKLRQIYWDRLDLNAFMVYHVDRLLDTIESHMYGAKTGP